MPEIQYIGRDNPLKFQLLEDGVAIGAAEMALITKAKVLYKGTYFSSEDYSTLFDWATEASDSHIIIRMGTMTGLEAGRDREAELIIYTGTFTRGIIWDKFDLQVVELPSE